MVATVDGAAGASRLLAALATLLLVVGLAGPARAAGPEGPLERDAQPLAAPQTRNVPGSLLVTTAQPVAAARLHGRLAGGFLGAQAESVQLTGRVLKVTVPAGQELAAVARLAAQPGVVAVEPDRIYDFTAVPDDPGFAQQWAHELIGSATAWDVTRGTRDVRVAVLDSGMDGRHPDLLPNLAAQVDASTGVIRPRDAGSDNATCPQSSARRHGTWVGGVVGAVGNNAIGIAGINWKVSMLDVALTSAQSVCFPTDSAIITGLGWVRDQADPVDAVNLSIGGASEACPTALQAALDEVRAQGTVVVAAAGNSGRSVPYVPASCNGVLSVGAVGHDAEPAIYSTSNAYVDLAAPGGGAAGCSIETCVLSTARDDGYEAVSGTSLAAPYVAGAAALLRAARPELTADQIESLLERTALHPQGKGVRDDTLGWGVLHAGDALERAISNATIPEAAANPNFPVAGAGSSGILRVRHGGGATEPISQAVAMSRVVFADSAAAHVVIARSDDFADALAGSALGYGVGPLLFTPPTGSLSGATRNELERVLPPGGRVYLLGGSAALDPGLEAQLTDLGYRPKRLAGRVREGTARAVAVELRARLAKLEATPPSAAILATRGDWPDAVTAGSLGAIYGIPILLTQQNALHDETASALADLRPETLYVVGGTAVLSEETVDEAVRVAGATSAPRLSGRTRDETAVAVATELGRQLEAGGAQPAYGITVNLDRPDGFAHVLSASSLSASTLSLFLGVRGLDGNIVPEPAAAYACNLGVRPLLVGDVDLVPNATGEHIAALLRGEC